MLIYTRKLKAREVDTGGWVIGDLTGWVGVNSRSVVVE